jgi:EAL domain-containing protein (putative c-di-GMP-specific phosphodiesterase class I)
VSPGEFIPVAEAAGLVAPLGRWVLGAACAQLARWRAQPGAAALRVSVNVSGAQLEDIDALVADVRAALDGASVDGAALPPDALVLEMTEGVLMQHTDATLGRLAALKALGVGLAVDDFGTGYSSLAYLQRFPVDVLKLDKAFVDGVAEDGGDRAIARTVLALGAALGLRVVAEGVERDEQRAALTAMGCVAAQGLPVRPPPRAGRRVLVARRGRGARRARAQPRLDRRPCGDRAPHRPRLQRA